MNNHILLVDDDEEIAGLLQHWIAKATPSTRITWVENGLDALSAARKESPDAVILDLGLPGPGGLTILSQLRGQAVSQSIPVLVITGTEDPEVHQQAHQRGNAEVMVKPLDQKRFVEWVHNACAQPAP